MTNTIMFLCCFINELAKYCQICSLIPYFALIEKKIIRLINHYFTKHRNN